MADIFEEVEEDLRAERARRIALRYGGLAALAAVVVVGAIGGWQGYRWYQLREDREAAEVFMSAMRSADSVTRAGGSSADSTARDAAHIGFARLAAAGPEGYRTLARLREAALRADAGDASGASALWDQVANDASADRRLRDLASLLWVDHQLGSGDPGAIRGRLAPLTPPDNPWHALAQEAQALLDVREGHDDDAKRTLHALAQDTTAPNGVRTRANGLLARLGG